MAIDNELEFPYTLWYGQTHFSPEAANTGVALKFRLEPVKTRQGLIVGLFGSYHIGVNFAGQYATGFPAPLFLVAVSATDGSTYVRELTDEDDMPVTLATGQPKPSIQRVDAAGKPIPGPEIHESGFFNLDIARHLGLPAKADRYQVFLWLEHLVSDSGWLDLPENPARHAPGSLAASHSGAIQVAARSQPTQAFEIRLAGSGAERAILGSVCLDPATLAQGQALPLDIIAITHRGRRPGWSTVGLGPSLGRNGCVDFRLPTGKLGLDVDSGERFFAVATLRGQRSNVLDSQAR